MTHGEEWGRRKRELEEKIARLNIKLDLDQVDITAGLPPKMKREEAERYYNKKLQDYWLKAGYYKKSQKLVAMEWIRYWIEKAYYAGYEDAKEELNER